MVYGFMFLLSNSNSKEVFIFPHVVFLVYYILISSLLVIVGTPWVLKPINQCNQKQYLEKTLRSKGKTCKLYIERLD